MTTTPKRRRTFIGKDPIYTSAPSVPSPPSPKVDADAHRAGPRSDAGTDEGARDEAIQVSSSRRNDEAAAPRQARTARREAVPGAGESVELSCRVWLDDDVSGLIDRLREWSGLERDALLRYVRDGVVSDFREALAEKKAPKPLPPTPRRGSRPHVQIRLRLSGEDLDNARRRLDPLEFGRTAMLDQAQAMMGKLYRRRLERMAERAGVNMERPAE